MACGASSVAEQRLPAENGGSIPTAPLLKRDWIVDSCGLETAQRLVRRFHYSHGGSNTAVATCGLFRRGEFFGARCYGATWWLPPTKSAALSIDANWNGVLALSRTVCVPDAPSNAASFLIRHSMRFIDRERWPVLVTYADKWQGHAGGIYKALKDCGWQEDGETKPQRTYVRANRMVSRKRGPTTLTHDEMLASGCECVGKFARIRFVNRRAA